MNKKIPIQILKDKANVMGHIFQDECWEKDYSGNHFQYIYGYGNWQRQRGIN